MGQLGWRLWYNGTKTTQTVKPPFLLEEDGCCFSVMGTYSHTHTHRTRLLLCMGFFSRCLRRLFPCMIGLSGTLTDLEIPLGSFFKTGIRWTNTLNVPLTLTNIFLHSFGYTPFTTFNTSTIYFRLFFSFYKFGLPFLLIERQKLFMSFLQQNIYRSFLE